MVRASCALAVVAALLHQSAAATPNPDEVKAFLVDVVGDDAAVQSVQAAAASVYTSLEASSNLARAMREDALACMDRDRDIDR